MEIIFEIAITFIAEFIGPLFFELLAEFGIRNISHTFEIKRAKSVVLSLFGYCLLAVMLAIFSLYISNEAYIQNPTLQILNFFVTPIGIAIIMKLRGKKLIKDEREITGLNQFWYGFSFAFTFVVFRYLAIKNYVGIS